MKVSVLVPVYGVERYITQCVTSLMQQTYEDVEYVFVNDCTPDDSITRLKDVVDKYPGKKPNVKIIDHEHNMGLASARQSALDIAAGEAVIIVDSDDYVDPKMIEVLVDEMQRSDADIVDGGYAIVSNNNVVKEFQPMHVGDKAYLRTILCQNVEPTRIWGRLIKKSLFAECKISFTPGVDYCEDFSVLPRLLVNARRSWANDCLYFYRNDNPQSYTNNISTKNAVSFLKAQNIVGEYFSNHQQWNTYSFAAQIGWVDVWRFTRRFNVDKNLGDEYFKLKPSSFIPRCLTAMMKSHKMPYRLINFLYLATRRLYLMLMC